MTRCRFCWGMRRFSWGVCQRCGGTDIDPGDGDPICAGCGSGHSHLAHHDSHLYNFHEFEAAGASTVPEPGVSE